MPRKASEFKSVQIIGEPSIPDFIKALAFIHSQRTGIKTTITTIRDRRTGEEIYHGSEPVNSATQFC